MKKKFKVFSDPEQELEYRKILSMADLFSYFDWKKSQELSGKKPKWFRCCARDACVYVEEGEKPKCSVCGKQMDSVERVSRRTPGSDTVSVPMAYDKLGRPIPGCPKVRVSRKASEL